MVENDAVLEAVDLGFTYPESDEGISHINFKLYKGEVVLLTGDSGSGKSTLLKCLNGLIPSVTEGKLEGHLYAGGKDLAEMKMHERNRIFGSVFQNPRTQFFTENTTAELVFTLENYGFSKEDMQKKLDKLTKEFGLEGLLNRNIHTLSSGERQKVALACALSMDQMILLFDEPSANLDYGSAMRLGEIIRELKKRKITVIVADHRFYYLKDIIDKVLLMKNGQLEVYNSEEDFKSSGYDTRSFDLFGIETVSHTEHKWCECVTEVENVSYKDILKDVSLQLCKGEITALIGSNGVGKTTLARLLCGSIKPGKGHISNTGMPFYIMQDPDYQLFGTSSENELLMVRKDPGAVDGVLDSLGLTKQKNSHPFDLSGGQKQRLQIGMAILCDRDLIIFDEPTSGLDSKSMERVSRRISSLRDKASILVISHDYEFIRRVADRVVYLDDGRIKSSFELNESTVENLNSAFKEMQDKAQNLNLEE